MINFKKPSISGSKISIALYIAIATDGTKLFSSVLLRNNAEILVVGPYLSTKSYLRAMIGMFKNHCQFAS